MIIFDSFSRKKVKFEPEFENFVRIYVCGPTVYDDAHLGHAKSSVSFDLLRRVLTALGFKVKFVKNFTDIDDKILKKMRETGQNLGEITEFYIGRYLSDMEALNVQRADIEPKATETLAEIIQYIESLEAQDVAYRLNDGIYFDTAADKEYLSLSKQNDENTVARVKSNDEKRDEKDFVLWKFDENFYESPFGRGRPGWHTECVAMIKKHLDEKNSKFGVDIHAGGMDLLFPHHENECAQCRCSEHKNLAKYWMHNGFVQVNNEKMSKSLNNSFFIKDALKIVPGEVLRFYLLSSHYRANFNYSVQDLMASKKRLDKIYRLKKRLIGTSADVAVEAEFKEKILEALSDDLNSSLALSHLDLMVNSANLYLDEHKKDKAYKAQIWANLEFAGEILGILQNDPVDYLRFCKDDEKKFYIAEIEKIKAARKNRDFAAADAIREKLQNSGVYLQYQADGEIDWEVL